MGLDLVFLFTVSCLGYVELQWISDVQPRLINIVIELVAKFAGLELIGQIFFKEDHVVAE